MMNRGFCGAWMAGVLAVATLGCSGEAGSDSSLQQPSTAANGASEVSLLEAATRAAAEGEVVEIERVSSGDGFVYEADVWIGAQLVELIIDPASGDLLRRDETSGVSAPAPAGSISLMDAISIAEERTGLAAVEAELEESSYYEVTVLDRGVPFEVEVSLSGEVIEIEREDDDD